MRILVSLVVSLVLATVTTNAPLFSSSTNVNRDIIDSLTFNFYADSAHLNQLAEAFLGDDIHARVATDPSVENLTIELNSCYATATSNPGWR